MLVTWALPVFIAKHKRFIVCLQSLKSAILDLKLNRVHQVVRALI